MVTQEIDLNLIPSSEPVVVHLSQYDEGYHRLICHLYAGAVPYEPVSSTVKVQGTKPDKHGFQYYCDIDGSTVYVDINLQMTACMGRVPTQLIVTESTGVTGSFAFVLDVQESTLVLDVDISETDIPILTEEAQEAAQRSVQAAAQSAESAAEAESWSAHPPYVGLNKHWYVYDIESEQYADSNIYAEGVSPYIGENKHWYVWDVSTETYIDSEIVAEGKDGSQWYRGTAVEGKSVVPTVFPTGIALAHTGDQYLNVEEGAIYHCQNPGDAETATWVYDFTMSGGGGGGTDNYNDLINQPSIGGVTLTGNKTIEELGGVQSFNGRSGSILPMAGDYTGSQVNTFVTIGGAAQTTVDGALAALDNRFGVVVAYGGQKTFADLTSALLVAENENKFFLITTGGYLTSADLANWAPSYIEGDHIAVDSHIAVVNFGTAANPSYKFDDFGGFVETDEYTPLATCRTENSQTIVDFDNLNPDYGYDINYEVPSTATTITVPTYTAVTKGAGTNTGTIKLTFTLSGATAGTDQFSLRIKK